MRITNIAPYAYCCLSRRSPISINGISLAGIAAEISFFNPVMIVRMSESLIGECDKLVDTDGASEKNIALQFYSEKNCIFSEEFKF